MRSIKIVSNFIAALIFVAPYCFAMDKKRADESCAKKTLSEKLADVVQSNVLSPSKKVAAVSRLLSRGADVNTKVYSTPIVFKAAQSQAQVQNEEESEDRAEERTHLPLVKLFLKHSQFDAYCTDVTFISSPWSENDYPVDVTLLEWAGYNDRDDLLKLLIYLGHESHAQLDPKGFDDKSIRQLIAVPHAYQFSEKEKSEYEDTVLAIGANNGEKLKPIFTDLELITEKDTSFIQLAPLIGQYLGLGLLMAKVRRSACKRIAEICTIL